MDLDNTPPTSWFFQEYNPLLARAGELKVIIANKCKVLRRVLCRAILESPNDVTGSHEVVEELHWSMLLSDMDLR
jgi:hypothetical protein